MAQLNDTMVQGDLRVTGTAYGTLSGNASTATAWQTSRDFVIKDSTAAHSGTSVSVNGGAAVTLKLPSIITATLDGNASSATVWQTPRDFVIKDSTAAHSGTSASVDGGAGVTLKLPATITASLAGNASTASIAYALANSDGSGPSAKAVAGNLNGFSVTYGTSGTNGFLSSNLGPGVLTISNRVSSSTTNTTTIASNSASFGGSLTVAGGTSCNGGLGVKTGFSILNNSNTPVATIANNGDIATSGTVTATGNMSTSGALTAAGSITSRSGIACENGPIYVADTTVSPAAVKAQIKANGDIELSGMLIGDIQDFGNSSRHMRIGWGGTAIQKIVTSNDNPTSLSESAYLVGIYIANNVVYYKDVHASNVRVGNADNADACGGYKVVVGSFGTTTGTLYFA